MSSYILFEALKIYYGDAQEALNELMSFSDFIKTEPKSVAFKLDSVIKEQALEHNLCPECLNSINKKRILNDSVDCRGREVNEEMEEIYCDECGWSSED